MLPGIGGLISLPTTAAVSFVIGNLYVSRLGGLHPLGKVARHSIMIAAMSAFYFAWAAYKLLMKGDSDFGVVTFLIAFVASYRTADLCAVQISRDPKRSKDPTPVLRMQTLLPVSCFVVCINYLAVLVLNPTLPTTFQLYLCAGSVVWSVLAIRGGWLLGEDSVVTSLRMGDAKKPTSRGNDERQRLMKAMDQDDPHGAA